jgi:integrase
MASITLTAAQAEYEAHLRARDLANNTIKNNTQVVTRAVAAWGDMLVASIKPVHIDRLFQQNNWSPSTRNLYLGNLRQFFKWCRHHGYMGKDYDPTFGWRNARVPNQQKMRLPVHEFTALLDTADHPRDRAALALGLYTFVRGSELATLRVNDLDLGALTIDVYRIKTKDYDTLPVCEELRVEMVRWLNWYRQDQGNLVGNWFLVPSKKPDEWHNVNGRLVPTGRLAGLRPEQRIGHTYTIPQRALARLGYDVKGEGEHTLRRSGARALFDVLRVEQGTDALVLVSSMLGHRDTKVTQHYIGLEAEREKRNASLAGKPMFPELHQAGTLRVVGGESSGRSSDSGM